MTTLKSSWCLEAFLTNWFLKKFVLFEMQVFAQCFSEKLILYKKIHKREHARQVKNLPKSTLIDFSELFVRIVCTNQFFLQNQFYLKKRENFAQKAIIN